MSDYTDFSEPRKGTFAWATEDPSNESYPGSEFIPSEEETANTKVTVNSTLPVRNNPTITQTPSDSEYGKLQEALKKLDEYKGGNFLGIGRNHISRREMRRWANDNGITDFSGFSLNGLEGLRQKQNGLHWYNQGVYDQNRQAALNFENSLSKYVRYDLNGNRYLEGSKEYNDLDGQWFAWSRKEYQDKSKALQESLDNYQFDPITKKKMYKNLNGDWVELTGKEDWALAPLFKLASLEFNKQVADFDTTGKKSMDYSWLNDYLTKDNVWALLAFASGWRGKDLLNWKNFSDEDKARIKQDFANKVNSTVENPVERAWMIQKMLQKLGNLNDYYTLVDDSLGLNNTRFIAPYYEFGHARGIGTPEYNQNGSFLQRGGHITYFADGGKVIRFDQGGSAEYEEPALWRSFVPGLASYDAIQAYKAGKTGLLGMAGTIGLDALSIIPGVGYVGKLLGGTSKTAKVLSKGTKVINKITKNPILAPMVGAFSPTTNLRGIGDSIKTFKRASGAFNNPVMERAFKIKNLAKNGKADLSALQKALLLIKGKVGAGAGVLFKGSMTGLSGLMKHQLLRTKVDDSGVEELEIPAGENDISLGNNAQPLGTKDSYTTNDGYYDPETGLFTLYNGKNERFIKAAQLGGYINYFKY